MPLQNRVTPFGEIIATSELGTFMGNRGILHDEAKRVRRLWQGKRWLICVLEFRGRQRTVMKPNSYTELFFLDEATALAAGHRPCAECRHERFIHFCQAWKESHPTHTSSARPTADEIDNQLHMERTSLDRSKPLFEANLDDLPDGVFVKGDRRGDTAYLVLGNILMAWSAAGYTERIPRRRDTVVQVLTPKSTVETIRAGYIPEIHPTARSTGSRD